MKILLIEASRYESIASGIFPPLGLYCLESYARRYAHFDVEFEIVSSGDASCIDPEDPPHIIGISSVTTNFTTCERIAVEAREILGDEVPIILGGCHISAMPESLPSVFDVAVVGEGEVTFLEILEVLHKRGRLEPQDFRNIDGIAYRQGDVIIRNKERVFLKNLDEIPFPARKLPGIGVTHMLTSRGCPYSCVYCATCLLWGKVRSHSPEYVVNEIRDLYKGFHINEIILFDDNFLADRKRVNEISQKIAAGNLAGKVSFICYGRTGAVNKSIIRDLIKMGVTEIYLGADNVSNSLINGRGSADAYRRNARAIDLCYNAGLKVNCSFVIGLPYQLCEDLDEILRFITEKRNKVSVFQISPVNLFPGTPLWRFALQKGKIPEFIKDWSQLEHFTPISAFSPDKYIYINEMMSKDVFTDYCRKFADLLNEVE